MPFWLKSPSGNKNSQGGVDNRSILSSAQPCQAMHLWLFQWSEVKLAIAVIVTITALRKTAGQEEDCNSQGLANTM
eukprot:4156393-Karenia_brevis.AAC.1